MKKLLLVFALAVGLMVGTVTAQDAGQAETFQFVNFNFGVTAGYSLDDDPNDGLVGAVNFGIDFAVFDKLQIGIDVFKGNVIDFTGLHLGYAITPKLVAGIGIGASSTPTTAVTLGISYNIFGGKSEVGIFHALKLRADYIVPNVGDFGKGTIGITLGASFGA